LQGHPAPFGRALAAAFPGWEAWAVLAPAVFWFGRRVPLRWPTGPGPVAAHLGFSLLVGAVHALVHATCGWLFALRPSNLGLLGYYEATLLDWLPISILTYWTIIAIGRGLDYYHRFREEQVRAADLGRRLTEARLEALTAQLHPHFLFNTLNAAVALVRTGDNPKAAKVLTQLGDILRHLLQTAPSQEVTLRDELAFLERYLEIELIRFSHRLTVKVQVPDELLDAAVPNLILQPLVENAIRHGLASHDRSGSVELEATASGGMLRLQVRDDGPGLPADWSLDRSAGVGLGNVRSRIAHLYGNPAGLDVRGRAGGGVEATITIPLSPLARPSATPALEVA
jgi:signal transduction histidine kinase